MDPIDRLWSVARDNIGVDAEQLFAAIIDPAVLTTDDPRTRLLVRDSVAGLRRFWGCSIFDERIKPLPQRAEIEAYFKNQPPDIGFPSLRERIMNVTDAQTLTRFCRDLGRRLREPASITVGGSMALIIQSLIVRQTEDIDVVDELPPAVRQDPRLLEELLAIYELKLAHFQSRYLPRGWDRRTWSLGVFDLLTVLVIDPGDVLIGKLFSRRPKDFKDILSCWAKLDGASLRRRLAEDTAAFRSDAKSFEAAKHNWYVLTGEQELP